MRSQDAYQPENNVKTALKCWLGMLKKNEGENQRNSSGKDPITNVIFLENNDIMFPLALLYEK